MTCFNDCALKAPIEPTDGFEALGEQVEGNSFNVATCRHCQASLFHFVEGHGLFCGSCLTNFTLS